MNRRLYYVIPDVSTAQALERELLLARIDSGRMHFLAKRGTDLKGMNEAGTMQKTDILHGMQVGLLIGIGMGLALGAVLYMNPELIGANSSQLLIFVLAVAGGAFGAWASGIVGSSTPNVRLKQFQQALDDGHVLLMLDIPLRRIEEVRDLVKTKLPQAEDKGLEPTVPMFP